MTQTPDTSAEVRELLLNLSSWIERRKNDIGPYADHIIHSVAHYEREIERLRADLSRPAPVTVKPLEWVREPRNVSFVDAEFVDSLGIYCIAERVLFIGHAETGITFDSVDEAKAAAQADYERRILSAPTPAPVTPAQAARVLLADRWGGYGNRAAMHAMWNFVHDEFGRHMVPVSHYDGIFMTGLKALAEQEQE